MDNSVFLLVLAMLMTMSGADPKWVLVSDSVRANFLSQILVRLLIGVALRWTISRIVGSGLTTDVLSIILSQVFPSGILITSIAVTGYASICFRYVYDLLATGHGIIWMFHQIRNFFENQSCISQGKHVCYACSHMYRRHLNHKEEIYSD